MGTNAVEEVTVVAHNKHGMLKVCQILLKPYNSLEVEVVGRLVEQQVIRISKQSLSKHHAHLLLTAKFLHVLIVKCLLDAKTAKKLGCIALGIVSVEFSKLLFKFGNLYSVLVAEILLHVKGILLLHNLPEHGMSHKHGIKNRKLIKLKVVLTQYRQTLARAQSNCSLVRLKFARDCLQKCRFSCAVGTDNTIDITICKLNINIFIQNALAKLNGQI